MNELANAWWQISAIVDRDQVAAVEDDLLASGAVAITLRDAGDDPQFEPLPGEQPMWPNSKITGLFPIENSPEPALRQLLMAHQVVGEVEPLADRDWEREWLKHFKPLKFGGRLWIQPTGMPIDANADDIVVHLDPGLAFGTGTHPTTALCLDWLSQHLEAGDDWIDYGCGSGILAVSAAKLGASAVYVIDIDPQALIATEYNASRNQVNHHLRTLSVDDPLPQADGLVANILAGPLQQLAEKLSAGVKPGGYIVLSGILAEQGAAVQSAYQPFFSQMNVYQQGDWLCVVGQRNRPDNTPC